MAVRGVAGGLASVLVGTTTNDNAAPGIVGEYISASVVAGSAVALTTATGANVTSISLTAGDWDVWGNIGFVPAATTNITQLQGGCSTTSAQIPGVPNAGFLQQFGSGGLVPGAANLSSAVVPFRFSLAVTTTVFLTALANFTVSTLGAYGFIAARRRR